MLFSMKMISHSHLVFSSFLGHQTCHLNLYKYLSPYRHKLPLILYHTFTKPHNHIQISPSSSFPTLTPPCDPIHEQPLPNLSQGTTP